MTERTSTGARLADVTVADPVTERGAALDAAHDTYMDLCAAAMDDYRDAIGTVWATYKTRIDGLAAEYDSAVERIRSAP